jgi:hypothetical protein
MRKCTGFITVVERLDFMDPAFSSGVMEVEDFLHPVTVCQLLRKNFSLRIWLFSAVQFLLNLWPFLQLLLIIVSWKGCSSPQAHWHFHLLNEKERGRGRGRARKKGQFFRNGMLHVMISIATWIKDKTNIKSTLWNDSTIYCHTITEIRPCIPVLSADEHWPFCVLPCISLNWMLQERNLRAPNITVFLFFFSTNNDWEIRTAFVLKMCLYFGETEVYIPVANILFSRGEGNL